MQPPDEVLVGLAEVEVDEVLGLAVVEAAVEVDEALVEVGAALELLPPPLELPLQENTGGPGMT